MTDEQSEAQGSRSPTPPPWSPITPSASRSTLKAPVFDVPVDLPPNVPISESTNTDVIALRAALTELQMLRLRTVKDIQTMDKQRKLALQHPEEFDKAWRAGTIYQKATAKNLFEETLLEAEQSDDIHETGAATLKSPLHDFGIVPAPRHIPHCPPVEWAKYHVVGEVLDRLHNQQTGFPDSSQINQSSSFAKRKHVFASPYSPWHDNLAEMPKDKTSRER